MWPNWFIKLTVRAPEGDRPASIVGPGRDPKPCGGNAAGSGAHMLFSFQRPSASSALRHGGERKSLSDGEAHLLPPFWGGFRSVGLSVVEACAPSRPGGRPISISIGWHPDPRPNGLRSRLRQYSYDATRIRLKRRRPTCRTPSCRRSASTSRSDSPSGSPFRRTPPWPSNRRASLRERPKWSARTAGR